MGRDRGEAGYTLSEMVAALLIVSLAMGGAFQATWLIEHQQRATLAAARGQDWMRDTSRRFADLLAAYQPPAVSGAGLQGDARGFRFACGRASCGAQLGVGGPDPALQLDAPAPETLALAGMRRPRFAYVTEGGESEVWPVASAHPSPLQAVLLLDDAGGSVLSARVWREEPAGCRFDVIARACREASVQGGPPAEAAP